VEKGKQWGTIAKRVRDSGKEIEFLDGRKGAFRFECKGCGRCCREYMIVLTTYDILRLKRATGRTTRELIAGGTVRILRLSFKKAFGFGPVADMLDLVGVSRSDVVPVATLGFQRERSGGKACEFLTEPTDGRRLCSIYEDRPGMCRLHPLGCMTIGARRKWFFRRPLCEMDGGGEWTVEGWIKESRMRLFLAANARYLRWMRELLEGPEDLGEIPEEEWKALEAILFDFDSIERDRRRIGLDVIEEIFGQWLARVRAGGI
jgi:Fe-S-cluster containining protein